MLAWLFAGNVLVGWIAAQEMATSLGAVLDRSLAADRLVNGFDLATLGETLSRPQVQTRAASFASLSVALIYLLLVFVVTPGIAAEFLADAKLGTEEFFRVCGRFFWRYLRLTLWSLLIFIPALGLLTAGRTALVKLADRTTIVWLPFGAGLAAGCMIVLVGLALRAWFDVALCELETSDERNTRRSLRTGVRLLRARFQALYWAYVASVLAAIAVTGIAAFLWMRFVPPFAVAAAMLPAQLIVFAWIAARLWQRAAAAVWYRAAFPAPQPVVVAEPLSPVMPSAEPDLPPIL